MPLRLLHFADTHIGVETYGRVDPATGRHTRLADFEAVLGAAVTAALEAGVHAALFAGDAYRTCDPSPTHQQVFAAAIRRLVEAGVPVVMVPGNHDLPVTFGRADALDIFRTLIGDRVTVLARPAVARVETAAGPLQVAGLPWPTRSLLRARDEEGRQGDQWLREQMQALCQQTIGSLAEELEPGVPAVLLAHVTAADAVFSGSERMALGGLDPTLSRGVLADRRFDYVALGHVHRHQELNGGERPPVVYPGSLERIDFGEAGDVKGVCLVEIGEGASPAEREVSWRQVPLATRRMVELHLGVPESADATQFLGAELGGHALGGAIFRLYYRCTDEQYAALDLRAVRAAMPEVHLVAGLIRERPAAERRPAVEITEHHGVMEALGRYLDTRAELAPLREELAATARELDDELGVAEMAAEEEA
ncbi:MAG: exonuclease SbcCD subunit D [Armatimonadetes bacterium]|nr:exonuclease SbcCD subunit D [Armatimonadota bacterium]